MNTSTFQNVFYKNTFCAEALDAFEHLTYCSFINSQDILERFNHTLDRNYCNIFLSILVLNILFKAHSYNYGGECTKLSYSEENEVQLFWIPATQAFEKRFFLEALANLILVCDSLLDETIFGVIGISEQIIIRYFEHLCNLAKTAFKTRRWNGYCYTLQKLHLILMKTISMI